MKKIIYICSIILLFSTIKAFAQYDEYSEYIFGCTLTHRNKPDIYETNDSSILPCRKLIGEPLIFDKPSGFDFTISKEDSFNSNILKNATLITNFVWQKKDTNMLHFIYEFAENISFKHGEQYYAVSCLSSFKNKKNINFLLKLLRNNDKRIVLYSALSLVQLGIYDISFDYIEKFYTEVNIRDNVHTALMLINSTKSIKLLMKLAEDTDPSNALDALGALSLMGYCDFAFKGFCKYVNSEIWQVRQKVAWCLAYYIGTDEAFEIIYKMQNDEEIDVQKDILNILNIYKNKN